MVMSKECLRLVMMMSKSETGADDDEQECLEVAECDEEIVKSVNV